MAHKCNFLTLGSFATHFTSGCRFGEVVASRGAIRKRPMQRFGCKAPPKNRPYTHLGTLLELPLGAIRTRFGDFGCQKLVLGRIAAPSTLFCLAFGSLLGSPGTKKSTDFHDTVVDFRMLAPLPETLGKH